MAPIRKIFQWFAGFFNPKWPHFSISLSVSIHLILLLLIVLCASHSDEAKSYSVLPTQLVNAQLMTLPAQPAKAVPPKATSEKTSVEKPTPVKLLETPKPPVLEDKPVKAVPIKTAPKTPEVEKKLPVVNKSPSDTVAIAHRAKHKEKQTPKLPAQPVEKIESKKSAKISPVKPDLAHHLPTAAQKARLAQALQEEAQAAINRENEEKAEQQRQEGIQDQYLALIQQTIRANWINPFPTEDHQVTLKISLDDTGHVRSVQLLASSGNAIFDRQVIYAIHKSSPLPFPKEVAVAAKMQSIQLVFSSQ